MAGNWPILRRDTQYATIRSALVESTGVCGIVVIGDAGVGKTTLARLVTQMTGTPRSNRCESQLTGRNGNAIRTCRTSSHRTDISAH